MKKLPKKDLRVTIRFTKDEYSAIEKIIDDTGWTQSEALRKLIFDRANNFKERTPNESRKIDRLLFYFNKTSNNLNQVAKLMNTANLEGKLTEKKLIDALNTMIKVEENFYYGVKLVTND